MRIGTYRYRKTSLFNANINSWDYWLDNLSCQLKKPVQSESSSTKCYSRLKVLIPTLVSPVDDSNPAPYVFNSFFSLHNPNSIVNQYSYKEEKYFSVELELNYGFRVR